jgi:hypothetical protein
VVAYRRLVRKAEGKRQLGRRRSKWEDYIEVDLKEIRRGVMGRTQMAQERKGPAAGSCEHGNEPSITVKGGEFLCQLNDYQFLKKDSSLWDQLLKEE